MNVVCIDFGSQNSVVTIVKNGTIEVVINETGHRETPSYIAFTQTNRIVGNIAKDQHEANTTNTIYEFKHLLGKKAGDRRIAVESYMKTFKVNENGKINICVSYMGQKTSFNPEQLLAMIFTKLKKNTLISHAQNLQFATILTVPCYFNSDERRSILDAAEIANINCLQLVNETTANALSYAYYKQHELQPSESRNVFIIDFGHTSIQVCAVEIRKRELKILSTKFVMIGGRDFDRALADYFCEGCKNYFEFDPRDNKDSYLKLLKSVEEVKKKMSESSSLQHVQIESCVDLKPHLFEISRKEMEKVCGQILDRVQQFLEECFTGWETKKIYAVEIVGGSTRINAVYRIIKKISKKTPQLTLTNESVAFGGAIYHVMMMPELSHEFKPMNIIDLYTKTLQVQLLYDDEHASTGLFINSSYSLPSTYFFSEYLDCKKLPSTLTVKSLDELKKESYTFDWTNFMMTNFNIDSLCLTVEFTINDSGFIKICQVFVMVCKKTLPKKIKIPIMLFNNNPNYLQKVEEKMLKESICKYEASLLRQKAREDLEKLVGVMITKTTAIGFRNFVTDQYMQILEHIQNWLSEEESYSEDTFNALKNELDVCNVLEMASLVEEIEQASDSFNMEVKKIINDEINVECASLSLKE